MLLDFFMVPPRAHLRLVITARNGPRFFFDSVQDEASDQGHWQYLLDWPYQGTIFIDGVLWLTDDRGGPPFRFEILDRCGPDPTETPFVETR